MRLTDRQTIKPIVLHAVKREQGVRNFFTPYQEDILQVAARQGRFI